MCSSVSPQTSCCRELITIQPVIIFWSFFFPFSIITHLSAFITGTIHAGEGFGARAAYCRWRLIAGPDWTLLDGERKGHSQISEADPVRLLTELLDRRAWASFKQNTAASCDALPSQNRPIFCRSMDG